VLTDPDLKRSFEHDLTGGWSGEALLVVRPADTAEVAEVLRECGSASVPVVPQGGHTGLVGGGTPRDGELVLSLTRLTKIEPLDRSTLQITVGAGTTLEQLQQHLRAQGLDFPLDLGARSAATIGGMVATNAGGQLSLRYGTMRAQVVGFEAVLADGRVVERLSGLLKDNAGFDLTGLIVGSEGSLAVVTRVRLRAIHLARYRCTGLFGLASLEDALRALERLKQAAPSLEAVDYFEGRGLEHVCAHLGIRQPFERTYPVYLVVDCAGPTEPIDELASVLDYVEESAIASDSAGREQLWRYREAHNETVRALGVPLKLDVSVPVGSIPAFTTALRRVVEGLLPAGELILWGHLGDGNVHVNILGAPPEADHLEEAVLRLAVGHGGSISAEHGIGLAKARWLPLCRSENDIETMRRLKQVFDPTSLLNPGRVLDV
jgi:FAD/FMN-containing dehydrogenase